MKTVQYWCNDRHKGQWDKIEFRNNCSQLIFNKGAKAFQWGRNSMVFFFFFKHGSGAIEYPYANK